MTGPSVAPPPVPPKDESSQSTNTQITVGEPTAQSSSSVTETATDAAGGALPSYEQSDLTPLQIQELTQNLLDETASERPLVSEVLPLAVLRSEYENGSGSFVAQIDYLANLGFKGIRRTRGDGDCFYRSVGFAYIDRLRTAKNQTLAVAKAMSLLDSMLPILEAAGFQRMVFEDFYDVMASLVRQIVIPEEGGTVLTPEVLLEAFQSPEVSNCIVVLLRLITSAIIRTDSTTYAPFLFDPETGDEVSPREFCERFVEAVGKEADHVQMTALSRALKINIRVAYLDGHSSEGIVNFVDFVNTPPEDSPDPPVLLYRPGHYDILTNEL